MKTPKLFNSSYQSKKAQSLLTVRFFENLYTIDAYNKDKILHFLA